MTISTLPFSSGYAYRPIGMPGSLFESGTRLQVAPASAVRKSTAGLPTIQPSFPSSPPKETALYR